MNKQLKEKDGNAFKDVFPINIIQNIKDGDTGKTLQSILKSFNSIFVEYKNNVEDTRNSIDESIRRKGLWVTYLPTGEQDYITEVYIGNEESILNNWADNSNWKKILNVDYNSTVEGKIPNGIITMEKLSPALQELLKQNNNIINYPDDEDLQADYGYLQFKDRKYNPDLASGKGYKILRKNWLGVNNVLTQDMINEENTIYVIRYDFDLNGKEIIIPEGCVLQFEGGSLSNGSINGNNTIIKSDIYNIFKFINIIGVWKTNIIYSKWFDFKNGFDNYNNLKNITNIQNDNIHNDIYINDIDILTHIYDREDLMNITSNTNIYFDNSIIRIISNNNHGGTLISILNKSNINIFNGTFIGDIKNHIFDSVSSEWNHCICIKDDSNNIKINGTIIKEFVGDGIDIVDSGLEINNKNPNNIIISDCYIDNNGRQGISIESGINININNCKIINTGKIYNVKPSSGLDIEPYNKYAIIKDIIIKNSTIINNQNEYDFLIFFRKEFIYDYDLNIIIENCNIENIYCQYRDSLNILNSKIKNITTNYYNYIKINDTIFNDILFIEGNDIKINKCNFNTINQNNINNLLIDNCYGNQLLFESCDNCVIQNSKFKSNSEYTCKGAIKNFLYIINTEIINTNVNGKIFNYLYSLSNDSKLKINKCIINKNSNITESLNGNIEIYNSIIDINNTKLKCSSKNITFINNIIKGVNDNKNNSFIDIPISSNIIALNNIIKDGYEAFIDGNINNKSTLTYLPITNIKITNYPKSINITYINNINIFGLFVDKPVNSSIGFAYFCTDKQTPEGTTNGITIYHKGNNVWVDALGRIVE